MPFSQQPVGLSPASLRLLDLAMTRAWLAQVATGATEKGADPAVCADLWGKVECLDKLQGSVTTRQRKNMARHKFKIGQKVLYHPGRAYIGPSLFMVTRLLPSEGGGLTYRIKSAHETTERVAKEHELMRSPGDQKS